MRTVGFLPGDEVVAAQTDPGDGTESGMIVTRGSDIEPLDGFLSLVARPRRRASWRGRRSSRATARARPSATRRSGSTGMLWETCEHQLGAFSPNGSLLVGISPYVDGLTFPTLSVIDAAIR